MSAPAALRRAAAVLAEHQDPDLRAVGQALEVVVRGEAESLDAALGLPPNWRARARRAERDDLIRRLADLIDAPTSWNRAHALSLALRRYRAAAWRHDRRHGPPDDADARRRLLYAVHRLDPNPPTSVKWLHSITYYGSQTPLPTSVTLVDAGSDTTEGDPS